MDMAFSMEHNRTPCLALPYLREPYIQTHRGSKQTTGIVITAKVLYNLEEYNSVYATTV